MPLRLAQNEWAQQITVTVNDLPDHRLALGGVAWD